MKTHKLRTLFPCLMLFILAFSMAACSPSSDGPETTKTPEITSAAPSEEVSGNTGETAESASNSTAVEQEPEESAEPEVISLFSEPGGFYKKKFDLTLSSPEGKEIYYTLDGSDPRTSETAKLYDKEISIYDNTKEENVYAAIEDISISKYQPPKNKVDKGIVIRAVEKNADGTYGEVETQSYFVRKTASYYSDFKVISMVTDADYLFDPDNGAYMVGSGYYEWKNSDDYVELHESDFLNPTNYNRDGKETEFPVNIQVFDDGVAVYSDNVGARISGNWTRANFQKSFRLYARKEYGNSKMKYAFFDNLTNLNGELIDKFDKVTLWCGGNDQTLHFRDAFIQDLARDLDVDIMEAEPYILFLNGEFWGFYLLREKAEDYYLQSHYGIDEKELTVVKNGELDGGTEENFEAYREFTIWAATADMTKEENYKNFCEQMDVQNFMDYMTVETFMVNNDWANGGLNNWIVWRSETINPDIKNADGKWRFILYDLDQTAHLWNSEGSAHNRDFISEMCSDELDFSFPDMLRNLCNNEEFRQAFYENYLHIMDTTFSMERVNTLLDSYKKTYGKAMKDTHSRFGMDWAAWSFDGEIENVRSFFQKRPAYAKRQLENYLGMEPEPAAITGENMVPDIGAWYHFGQADFQKDYSQNALLVSVSEDLVNSWDAQAGVNELNLEQGATYRLTFEASCSTPSITKVQINRFDGFGFPTFSITKPELTKDLTAYEAVFIHEMESNFDFNLCFNFGDGAGDYVIKNVYLQKIAN